MKKTWKKIISVLLVIAMVTGGMAGFSMLTGDPSTTFHYWYNETEKK